MSINDNTVGNRVFFSVVMPAYNAEAYIRQAVESVIAQTFTDWELVVVDDCSADSTPDIVEELALMDARIKLSRLDRNSGNAYKPRMRAILSSEGRYVVTLDADDYLEADFLEKMHRRISETGADTVFCHLDFGDRVLPHESVDTSAIYAGRDLPRLTLCGWKIAPNGAVKRELYLRAFEEPRSGLTGMNADELLSRELMIMADKVTFCDAVYHYRYVGDSVTKKVSFHKFEMLLTDVALKRLIYDCYPAGSEERSLVELHLFCDIVGLMTFWTMHAGELAPHYDHIYRMMTEAREAVDWKSIHDKVSRAKYWLLRAGVTPYRFVSLVNGWIKGRK